MNSASSSHSAHPASPFPLTRLPEELLPQVFAWLPTRIVVTHIGVVCKQFRKLSEHFADAVLIDLRIAGISPGRFTVLVEDTMKLNVPRPMLAARLTRLVAVRAGLPTPEKAEASEALLKAIGQLADAEPRHMAELVTQQLDEYVSAWALKTAGQPASVPALKDILEPGVERNMAHHKLALLDWLLGASANRSYRNVRFITTELMQTLCAAVGWTQMAADTKTRISLLETLIQRFKDRCFDRFTPPLAAKESERLEALGVEFGKLACAAMGEVPVEKHWELLMMLPWKGDQCLALLCELMPTVTDEDFIVSMTELEMAMRFGPATQYTVVKAIDSFARRIESLAEEDRASMLKNMATNRRNESEESRNSLFWEELKRQLPAFAALTIEPAPAQPAETVDEDASTDVGE